MTQLGQINGLYAKFIHFLPLFCLAVTVYVVDLHRPPCNVRFSMASEEI